MGTRLLVVVSVHKSCIWQFAFSLEANPVSSLPCIANNGFLYQYCPPALSHLQMVHKLDRKVPINLEKISEPSWDCMNDTGCHLGLSFPSGILNNHLLDFGVLSKIYQLLSLENVGPIKYKCHLKIILRGAWRDRSKMKALNKNFFLPSPKLSSLCKENYPPPLKEAREKLDK